jgi:hypothetical protein
MLHKTKEAFAMSKLRVWAIQAGHASIYSVWSNYPNSAGGVSVRLSFQNKTGKTIKYITFLVSPQNAVGDTQKCSIKGNSVSRLTFTGPLPPNKKKNLVLWKNIWYNQTITSVSLVGVQVEYMDGTVEELDVSEISTTYAGKFHGSDKETIIYFIAALVILLVFAIIQMQL